MADPTTYVILRRWQKPQVAENSASGVSGALAQAKLPDELWTPVGEEDATRRETAVEQYLALDVAQDLEEGDHEFRAVAKSAWPDETIPAHVVTKRVTTVGAKRRETSGAEAA